MTTPPFRADQVGSLLRPASVHDARARFERGEIDTAALRAVEDEAILHAIEQQQQVGLHAVTDGEFRRAFWHFDFFGGLDGVEIVAEDSGMAFKGVAPKPHAVHITGRIGFPADHPMLEHFRFVRDHASVVAKQCIPAPTVLHFRLAPESIASDIYPDRDALFADLAQTWRDAIAAFYAEGCRYLQFDDTAWAYLCSDEELERARERGLDTDGLADAYSALLNEILCAAATSAPPGSPPAATSQWLGSCLVKPTTTASSSSTTPNVPAGLNPCAFCPRAVSAWCLV
jgi:5-methyltetrahydropteroyltriglutamate--homocysteine methyltransferase